MTNEELILDFCRKILYAVDGNDIPKKISSIQKSIQTVSNKIGVVTENHALAKKVVQMQDAEIKHQKQVASLYAKLERQAVEISNLKERVAKLKEENELLNKRIKYPLWKPDA